MSFSRRDFLKIMGVSSAIWQIPTGVLARNPFQTSSFVTPSLKGISPDFQDRRLENPR